MLYGLTWYEWWRVYVHVLPLAAVLILFFGAYANKKEDETLLPGDMAILILFSLFLSVLWPVTLVLALGTEIGERVRKRWIAKNWEA